MKNLITNTEMTLEEVNEFAFQKSTEIANTTGKSIIPLIFEEGDTWAIGYFSAPTRMQIMSILGKGGIEPLFSGKLLLENNIIKNESDKRFLNDSPDFDALNIGAYLEAYASANVMSKNLAEKKTGK